jgi:threonine/homoserine/homoserine lactone efflux protein
LKNEFGKFDFDSSAKTQFWPAFRLGLFTNLTNVKAALFAVAFIPQFVPKSVSLGMGIIVLSCTQSLVSTTWYTSMILAVHKSSVVLAKPSVRRSLTAISALGIMFLALGLAFTSPR